ncbi:MAG: hypothetical protein GF408_06970 [Candidatus Omnitrophica bacterium]|nr:hypothetical protein [Candidatus Omnitrophota bacterium]
MSLTDIMRKFAHLEIYQKRQMGEDFIDIAVYNRDMPAWQDIMLEIFGEAVKPAGVDPTDEHQELTRPYNGICADQTLFFKETGGKALLAMFWPWQEDPYTTIKIGLYNKPSV